MRLAVGALAAIASGILLALANSLEPFWWAAWLAPIPLLVAAFRSNHGWSWVWAAIAALIGVTGRIGYDLMFLGIPGEAIVASISIVATGLAVTLTRGLVRRGRYTLAIFFYPAFVAGLGALAQSGSPHGTGGSLAYSQMTFLPVIQIASLAGTAGIVFTVALFAALVAVVFQARNAPPRPFLTYSAPALVVIAVLAFGLARLGAGPDAKTFPVGLAINDLASPSSRAPVDPADGAWKLYGLTLRVLAEAGAKLVVWPEKLAPLDAPAAERVKKLLGDAAHANNVYLVAGLTLIAADHRENRAWLFAPSGELIADYSKQHLVPGFETPAFMPGNEDVVSSIDGDKFGVAICKDMDFDRLGRSYSKQGITAMLVPAFDFDSDAWSHASMAVLRGVEGGFTTDYDPLRTPIVGPTLPQPTTPTYRMSRSA
jgi:apolipoprotein N-acyltransferase